MERYILLVDVSPELWERMYERDTGCCGLVNIRKRISSDVQRYGFSFVDHDFMEAPALLVNRAADIMPIGKAIHLQYQLKNFWESVKQCYYPYRKIDMCLNTNRQFLVFYTVYDSDEIYCRINKSCKYHEAMGYIRDKLICRMRLTHDPNEIIPKGYDYLIACTGDWKFLEEDIGLAIEDFILHDILKEPRNANKEPTKEDMDEILKTTTWYGERKNVNPFNPFTPGFDWRGFEYPPPKYGQISYTIDQYKINDPLFTDGPYYTI